MAARRASCRIDEWAAEIFSKTALGDEALNIRGKKSAAPFVTPVKPPNAAP